MIVITGAAGFIGSNLVLELQKRTYNDLILVDDYSNKEKEENYKSVKPNQLIHRNDFFEWLDANHKQVQFIFHLGARTNTAEFDYSVLEKLNLNYTKDVFTKCVKYGLPMLYASSGATYGYGEHGFSDNTNPEILKPLNPYGVSKNEFDKWLLQQNEKPFFWAGLKFFNVYGPNEYHKHRMASVVYHAYNQIVDTGKMKLFRSHNPEFMDGCQQRDFIYVKDVCDIMIFFMETRENSGIYNVGTGRVGTFNELAESVFKAMSKEVEIEYIDIPEDIRDKYQYYTLADVSKLRKIGYEKEFYTLKEGVKDYVTNYLSIRSKN